MSFKQLQDENPKSKGESQLIFPMAEVKRFMFDCMVKVGIPMSQADALATVLLEADYRGHFSHGMNRLEMYLDDIVQKVCNPNAEPVIIKESPGTALVDGNNGIGAYVSVFCMDVAIKKAKNVGIGIVSCRGSNHYGIACMYTLQAVKEGMIGMSFSNTSPYMSPTRSKKAALGTNPIAMAAPGENGEIFNLDMATTTVPVGKIEMERRRAQPLREGWAQGPDGKFTTDPTVAMKQACLMPLGGVEANSGYKGYGLACLAEMLCGILSGSSYGPNIRMWAQRDKPWNLGHCFIAIDISAFEPGFEKRLSDLTKKLRNLPPADPKYPVLVAGDPEEANMIEVDRAGGIRYIQNQLDNCKRIAAKYKVQEMRPKKK